MTPAKLSGKVLVVIGGTTGLGLSAARAFITEDARVVVVGRNPDHARAAEAELGAPARSMVGDATGPGTAVQAIDLAQAHFHRFDGLYHVAGGSGRRQGDGPLHALSDEGWDYTMQLNLTSLFYSNRAAANRFLEQRQAGTILNMTSVLGLSPSPKFFGTHAYAASKAGAIGLTRSCAAYYAKDNIRFNALAPALMATPMSERAQGDEATMDFIKLKQPLDGGRIGRPEDLDAAAVFFMSDDSRFVTGQILAIDGGWCLSEAHPSSA